MDEPICRAWVAEIPAQDSDRHFPSPERGEGMDELRVFLDEVKRQGLADGHFLGLLHVLIGRRLETTTGRLLSSGLTWRAVADLLKRVRWDKDAVTELGLDPALLTPRDRERYWYQAIARARVDSPEARQQAAELASQLPPLGYVLK